MTRQMQVTRQTTQPAAKRMTLGAVTRGPIQKPLRVVLYGVEGVGKTTFGSDAPEPIFLCAEDGTAHLDVARFPEPQCWQDALDAIDALLTEEHDFKTLVVDTADWLERLCWDHVCKKAGKADIESFAYGKGYVAALQEWRVLTSRLDALRDKRGMHIVILAHAHVRTQKGVLEGQDDWDRFELKMHKGVAGYLKEWADVVLFAQWEEYTREVKGRARGISTGARVIFTERRAAYDAKNRFGLPHQLPLSWVDFWEAVKAGTPASPDTLRAEVLALAKELGGEDEAKVMAWLDTNPDPRRLAQGADRLRVKVEAKRAHDTNESNGVTQ